MNILNSGAIRDSLLITVVTTDQIESWSRLFPGWRSCATLGIWKSRSETLRHAGDLEPPGERKWQSRGSGASRLETMRHAEDLKSPEQKETARNGICDLGGANLGIRSYLNKIASLYSLRHSATKIAAGICDLGSAIHRMS